MSPPSRRSTRVLPAVASLLLVAWPLAGQSTAQVEVEENVRSVPNGDVLARVRSGTSVSVLGRQGGWYEVVVEGWIWTRSLQMVDREGMDLVVSAEGGENLRAEPSGRVLGRLEEGTLLEELERIPGWIRARRRGWIWTRSVGTPTPPATVEDRGASGADPAVGGAGGREAASPPLVTVLVGEGGRAVLVSPDGDTLATAAPGSELEVVGREGNWARVQVEGWIWMPEAGEAGDGSGAAAPLTPADLEADPRAHRGRVVTWELQFISLEVAERVRTDFFEGERFLLTRYGGPDGPFVYVAVAPERRAEVEGLTPLESLEVTGRIRTGASALTGTPILDLMNLVRRPGAP